MGVTDSGHVIGTGQRDLRFSVVKIPSPVQLGVSLGSCSLQVINSQGHPISEGHRERVNIAIVESFPNSLPAETRPSRGKPRRKHSDTTVAQPRGSSAPSSRAVPHTSLLHDLSSCLLS